MTEQSPAARTGPSTGPNAAWKRGKPKLSYLLEPPYRKEAVKRLYRASEAELRKRLATIRWGHAGDDVQICPTCGSIDKHYWTESVKRWKCRAKLCGKQFSIFSGTRMHASKMELCDFMSLMFHFVEAKDSQSARELSGLHDKNHQTIHVAFLKIREALRETMSDGPLLEGYVQADAAYFIKYVRPGNVGTGASMAASTVRKNAGLDEGGKSSNVISENMHALVVFVQAGPQGRRHYKVAVIKTEAQVDLLNLGQKFCSQNALLVTDQHSAYNLFSGEFDAHFKVNHSKEFVNKDGMHTNFAESYFARMRAAIWGAWHRTSVQHLEEYGWEIAWRQTMVGRNNKEQLDDLIKRVLSCGRSERYRDYWSKLPPESRPPKEEHRGMLIELDKADVPRVMGRPSKSKVRIKPPKRRGSYRAPGSR